MNKHLPECAVDHRFCICHALRACEQRVREEWYSVQSETWEQGFHYALDAAREAVAALPIMKIAGNFPLCDTDDALAAIDSLRGES